MSTLKPALALYRRILERFPRNVSFCFAYGSGVKSQLGYENSKITDNVLDFIVAVDDQKLSKWHSDNIQLNRGDYSGLASFGGGVVTNYQRRLPASVYFNTLIPVAAENVTIKYGVVATSDLIRDCTQWPYLYLAGRLQKPVTIVTEHVPEQVAGALEQNLSQALSAALILLPAKFTAYELFYKVAQLSYRGDFRMVFGENPNKVQNIVRPQVTKFLSLYDEQINKRSRLLHKTSATSDEVTFEVDKSPEGLRILLEDVPMRCRPTGSTPDKDLAMNLAATVFKSSAIQSIKNIPTAGIIKAIKYSYSKAKKTFS